jgi:hypothetical protein
LTLDHPSGSCSTNTRAGNRPLVHSSTPATLEATPRSPWASKTTTDHLLCEDVDKTPPPNWSHDKLHDPVTYFAEVRVQAREAVKVEMARESR